MGKEDAVCIYNGILHSHKKEWNCAICNKDGLGGYHIKLNKSDGERQTLYENSNILDLKKIQQTSEYNIKEADS